MEMLMERRPSPSLASDGAWLLLAELNHRVCNELQVAMSALRLAKRELASDDPARFIEEAELRLEAFGYVHQLLDRQRDQGPISQRLEALCRATSLAKSALLGTHLRLTLDDVTADEEASWTICVVAFELMTNAFKHAFPGDLAGVVSVDLRREGEDLLLTVTDNGVGPRVGGRSDEPVWRSPGFGSGIVNQLAERLGGFVISVGGPQGTAVSFRVPAARSVQ
jgi:two-component system, sensor histidine kinase PdtaS